ncbi:MAG: cobalamin biosynthesis protein CobW [Lachnospiraceae bacterium]|nr:cobalamin biosynthesis protein CobW [Lachnospiraceae bacterium]
MTKIDIISGFLGAGKTTLIKKLLKEAYKGEQVVLIENEFGEIGIDGGFLKEAGVEIREMNSGCICCSLVGDFGEAMKEVIEKYHPDRIVIEPSGVGKLSDVKGAVLKVAKDAQVVMNSSTTVVDANKCKMYMRNFGEFFENQVEHAQTVILSRTDVAKPEKVQAAVQLLAGKMKDGATLVTTPIAQLSGEKLLEAMERPVSLEEEVLQEEQHHHHDHEEGHHHHHDHEEGHCHHDHEESHHHHHDHEEGHHHHHHDHEEGHEHCCHGEGHDHHHHDHDHHHHHHHADEVFTSWGRETAKTYEKAQLEHILDELSKEGEYGIVLRAKGMVPDGNGKWMYFDMVPEEAEIREGEPDYTGRLCVIGSKLEEAKLAELFGV